MQQLIKPLHEVDNTKNEIIVVFILNNELIAGSFEGYNMPCFQATTTKIATDTIFSK